MLTDSESQQFNQKLFRRFDFFNNLDTGVIKIMIPFLLIKMGISIGVFGLALSFRPLMHVLLRFLSGYCSDKFGRKAMTITGQLLGAFALLGYFFMNNVYHYIAIEIIRAFSAIIFTPSYKAWKKESCTDRHRVEFIMHSSRNRIIGTATGGAIVIGLGFILRTFDISVLGTPVREQHFFLIFFIFELSSVLFLIPMRVLTKKVKNDIKRIKLNQSAHNWNHFLFMSYNCASLSMASSIALPFTTAYLTEQMNLPIEKLGIFFSLSSVTAVLLSQKLLHFLKQVKPFTIIFILLLLESTCSFFLPFANSLLVFTFIWILYQLFQTSSDVLNSSQEQRAVRSNTAQMLQITGTAASLGMVVGNNLGGFIWHKFGSHYIYWTAGFLLLLIGLSNFIFSFKIKKSSFSLPASIAESRRSK